MARGQKPIGSWANCKWCGKQFWRRRSLELLGVAIYCSRACEVARRPTTKIKCTCMQCGTEFMKGRHEVTKAGGGKFCTRVCTDTFKRKIRKRSEQEMFTEWQKREWKDTQCAKCGGTERLELDHIIPRFAGGKAERANAQTLCRLCNRQKFWISDYPLYRHLLVERAN